MVIGITGGIGSGKSTVLNILKEKYNAYIIDADKTAHRLMKPGGEAYHKIKAYFGDSVIDKTGYIDRKVLGQIVFSHKEKLNALNEIVHPAVKKDIIKEIADIKALDTGRLIAVEAALFIEAGYMDICDKLWYIYTDDEVRIQRLMSSRGYSREKAVSIIENQLTDKEFRKHSNVIINNGSSFEETLMQIANNIEKG